MYLLYLQQLNKQLNKKNFLALLLLTIGALIPVLLQNQGKNPDRTPWADQWTQQFETHANGSSTWSGGLVYYSWKLKAYKISYQRSVFSPCQFFAGYLSECSFLHLNDTIYIVWPVKKACVAWDDKIEFPPPYQTAVNSVYLNTTTVNGTAYYVWTQKSDSQHFLYTSTDKKQINFWSYNFASNLYLDEHRYLDKSYYPVIQKDVFQLPEFCRNPSKRISMNDQQRDVLKKMFKLQNGSSLRK